MKCRKVGKCNGTATPTGATLQGLPVYRCTECRREFAVGKLKSKRRNLPTVGTKAS